MLDYVVKYLQTYVCILLNKEWLINIFNKYKYTKDVFPIIWKEKCYLIYYLIKDIYTKMNLHNFYKTTLVYKL